MMCIYVVCVRSDVYNAGRLMVCIDVVCWSVMPAVFLM